MKERGRERKNLLEKEKKKIDFFNPASNGFKIELDTGSDAL